MTRDLSDYGKWPPVHNHHVEPSAARGCPRCQWNSVSSDVTLTLLTIVAADVGAASRRFAWLANALLEGFSGGVLEDYSPRVAVTNLVEVSRELKATYVRLTDLVNTMKGGKL